MRSHTTKGVDTGRKEDHGYLYSLLYFLRGHPLHEFCVYPSLPYFKIYVCVHIYIHTYGVFCQFYMFLNERLHILKNLYNVNVRYKE